MDPTTFLITMAITIGVNLITMALTAKNVEQGKLESLDVDTASYGALIPEVWGKQFVTLQTVWIKNNELTERVRKDKIGPWGIGGSVTYYDYYVTCVMVACKGPATLSRLWMNDKLYEDRQIQLTGLGGIIDALFAQLNLDSAAANIDLAGTAVGPSNKSSWFRGEVESSPPGAMIAELGAQACPAMNGIAGIQLIEYPLADFGNSIPTLKAEVIIAAPGYGVYTEIVPTPAYSSETGFPTLDLNGLMWLAGENRVLVMDPVNNLVLADHDYTGQNVGNYTGLPGSYNAAIEWNHGNIWGDSAIVHVTGRLGDRINRVFVPSGKDATTIITGWWIDWPSFSILQVYSPIVPYPATVASAVKEGYCATINDGGVFVGPILCMWDFAAQVPTLEWSVNLVGLLGGGTLDYLLARTYRTSIIDKDTVAFVIFHQAIVPAGMVYVGVIKLDRSIGTIAVDWVRPMSDFVEPGDSTIQPSYGIAYMEAAGGIVLVSGDHGGSGDSKFALVLNEDDGVVLYEMPFVPGESYDMGKTMLQIDMDQPEEAWIPAQLPSDGAVLWSFRGRTVVRSVSDSTVGISNSTDVAILNTSRWNGVMYVSQDAEVNKIAFFDGAPNGDGTPVQAIVDSLLASAGMPDDFIDTTLAVDTVSGFRLDRQTNLSAIQDLTVIFDYEIVDLGYKYVLRPRVETSVKTIDIDDMGADTGKPKSDWLTYKIQPMSDLPKRVEVSFADILGDFENNLAYAFFPNDAIKGNKTTRISTGIAMTVTEAKTAAYKIASGIYRRRMQATTSLPIHKYGNVSVGDVVTFTDEGDTSSWKVESISGAYALQFNMTRSDPIPIELNTVGAERGVPPDVIVPLGTTQILYVDSHSTRIELDQVATAGKTAKDYVHLGVYRTSFSYTWAGATVLKSVNSGITYDTLFTEDEEARVGRLTTGLNLAAIPCIPDQTAITVRTDVVLTSSTTDAILASRRLNIAKIKCAGLDEWEIIQYVTATNNLDGTYTLSGLYRGMFGTEHLISTHGSGGGEAIVFESSDDSGTLTPQLAAGDFGNSFRFGALTSGLTSTSVIDTGTFVYAAKGLRPFSPANLDAQRNDTDVVITALRRDKHGSADVLDGGDTINSETGIELVLEIIKVSDGIVKRTVTQTASPFSFTYTSAMRTADGTAAAACTLKMYQVSSIVGRGVPSSISYTMP